MIAGRYVIAMLAFAVYLAGIGGPCICLAHAEPVVTPASTGGCCELAEESRQLMRGSCCCADEQALEPDVATVAGRADVVQKPSSFSVIVVSAQPAASRFPEVVPLCGQGPPTVLPWRLTPALRAPPPTAA